MKESAGTIKVEEGCDLHHRSVSGAERTPYWTFFRAEKLTSCQEGIYGVTFAQSIVRLSAFGALERLSRQLFNALEAPKRTKYLVSTHP